MILTPVKWGFLTPYLKQVPLQLTPPFGEDGTQLGSGVPFCSAAYLLFVGTP